ncbi:hypothetical protein K0M31_013356 [Melipona bicolor]|uniref:Uncharacterized protein n=1 Tax=Melipona bicolor TaxID=60889 RepID=A0AA40FIL7_9HYME|nr:hypothetical protein K0M31_013356 [Melipona bicolor]
MADSKKFRGTDFTAPQPVRGLPSPYNKQSAVGGAGGGPGAGTTSIPLPATVAATRRCPPDKVRPAPTPTHQSQLALNGTRFSNIWSVDERNLGTSVKVAEANENSLSTDDVDGYTNTRFTNTQS